jgi:hypothetical protein
MGFVFYNAALEPLEDFYFTECRCVQKAVQRIKVTELILAGQFVVFEMFCSWENP